MCNFAEKYGEYFKKKYKKNNNTVTWYYTLSLSLFILCILIYVFIPTYSSKENIDFLNEIINEFDKPLITYFNIRKYNFIFDKEERLQFGTWHGTNEGCYCEEDNQIQNKKCDENQILKNCENIKPIYPQYFKKYRGYYFIQQWWNRINKTTYRDILRDKKDEKRYIIVGNEENCPEFYKQSGIFDSFKNKLCVYNFFVRPINGIIISDQKAIENYSLLYNGDLPMNENKYLHYSRNNINGDIISGLFIFKDKPCYYSQENNWETFSELENGKGKGCKAKNGAKDERYKLIDSYNQYRFYNDNDILSYPYLYFMKNKDKRKLNNSIVKLYYRNYIGFNHSCLKERRIFDIYQEFWILKYTAEEQRLFYTRLSEDINYFIIGKFGKLTLFIEFLKILFFFFFRVVNWHKISNWYGLVLYFNIPEILIFFSFVNNFRKIKKRKKTVSEIIDNMYECCDEYTQYGLNLLKQKDNIINFHTFNIFFIIFAFVLILAVIFFVLNFVFNQLEKICDYYFGLKEHISLIEESNNKDNSNNNQQEVNNNEITNRRYENI